MNRSNASRRVVFAAVVTVSLAAALAGQALNARGALRGAGGANDPVFANGFGEAPDAIRSRQGFAIAPVPLDLDGRDPFLVGLGSYMVNAVGGCNDCHTNPPFAPGGDPYLGEPKQINIDHYLAGGNVFGPFVSRNITPIGPDGLPAGLTYEQFHDVITNGTDVLCAPGDPPPCPLLQVMPWPVLRHLSDHDIEAIYEYLSAIPHAEPGP
ncbi:MAG TPA: hypothetical protein VFG55_05415 [Rhodanobacteraceae bacterium]|nr:hypothetical protein [Rhodanobacteraceae bacterium]